MRSQILNILREEGWQPFFFGTRESILIERILKRSTTNVETWCKALKKLGIVITRKCVSLWTRPPMFFFYWITPSVMKPRSSSFRIIIYLELEKKLRRRRFSPNHQLRRNLFFIGIELLKSNWRKCVAVAENHIKRVSLPVDLMAGYITFLVLLEP